MDQYQSGLAMLCRTMTVYWDIGDGSPEDAVLALQVR